MKTESFESAARMTVSPSALPRSVPVGNDGISVRGLRVEALIGIYEHERLGPQPLQVDLELELLHSRCCTSDQIEDAVDYGAVVAPVRRLALLNRRLLLAAFAQDVADNLLHDFPLHTVAVSVCKPGIFDAADCVGVSIRRRRRDSTTAAIRA